MSQPSRVAVLRTRPDTVLADYDRLLELARATDFMDKGAGTILKDNISWHFPMPSANTTPWQLEGTIRALRRLGYRDSSIYKITERCLAALSRRLMTAERPPARPAATSLRRAP